MKRDWEAATVVGAWAAANGSSKFPYGDEWRMAIVNPIVLEVASMIADRTKEGEGHEPRLFPRDAFPLDVGLVVQRENILDIAPNERDWLKSLVAWHRMVATRKESQDSLSGVRILDLGCGEGCLGRWLNFMGASYLGVDVSKKLLAEANMRTRDARTSSNRCGRSKKSPGFLLPASLFHEMNLDGHQFDKDIVTLEEKLAEFGHPHLVIVNVLLEHLDAPEPLIRWVARKLSETSRDAQLLIFALNWDYYAGQIQTQSGECPACTNGLARFRANIASAEIQVDVALRSYHEIERLLRDNRLRVMQSGPLSFRADWSPAKEPPDVCGISPFIAFLAEPLPGAFASQQTRENLQRLFGRQSGPLHHLNDAQRDFLLGRSNEMELVSHAAGETVLSQHSLGGDLYVILDGLLELVDSYGRVTPFGPGEIIGELELGREDRATHYTCPVRAGHHGVTLIRIPSITAREFFSLHQCLGWALFEQLRGRVLGMNWSGKTRRRNAPVIQCGKEFDLGLPRIRAKKIGVALDGQDADQIARIFLEGAEAERQAGHRASEGNAVFLSVERINELAGFPKTKRNDVIRVVSALTDLGIIDGYPGDVLRQDDGTRDEYEERWKALVKDSVRVILGSHLVLSEGQGKRNFQRILSSYYLRPGAQWLYTRNDVTHWTEDICELKRYTRDCYDGDKKARWRASIELWLRYLLCANQFWFDRTPALFYLRDIKMLRRLALDTKEPLLQHLEMRRRALGLPEGRQGCGKKLELLTRDHIRTWPGRVRWYMRKVNEFFLADLTRGNKRLWFSSQTDSYAVPAWDPPS